MIIRRIKSNKINSTQGRKEGHLLAKYQVCPSQRVDLAVVRQCEDIGIEIKILSDKRPPANGHLKISGSPYKVKK